MCVCFACLHICFLLLVLLLLLLQVDAGSDQGDAAAWLVACLLSALRTTVHSMTQHTLQQAGQQVDAGAANRQDAWLLQQLHDSVACTTLGLLSGLFSLGQEFGSSCCKHALAYRQHAHTAAANSSASSAPLGGLPAVTAVLEAACGAPQDDLLLGLAAAVAAGVCAGICESLPPMRTTAAAILGPAAHEDFAAAADAAWKTTEQRRPQPGSSRQLLMQHAEALLSAVQAACSCSHANTMQQAVAGSNPAAAVGRGLLGQAYGRVWATCGHFFTGVGSAQLTAPCTILQQQQQQQQVIRPSLPGLLCTLQYLTDCCCSMAGVFYQAAGCHDAAAANAWLAVQQQQHPAQEVGLLARWLAGAAAAHGGLSSQELLQLLSALRGSGEQLARDYGSFQLSVQAAEAAGLDASAVRQQLDRSFAMHVAILSEVWQAAKAQAQVQAPYHQQLQQQLQQQQQQPEDIIAAGDKVSTCSSTVAGVSTSPSTVDLQAAVVATGLADLAALQFCRVQLPAYVELLRSMVTALATKSSAADAFIATALPCYEGLTQGHPAAASDVPAPAAAASSSRDEGSSFVQEQGACAEAVVPAAVWLQDTVTAAGLTFLLPLLPVAVRAASSAPAAAAQVLPLVLLLLPHPLAAVARAAHASFAGLVAVAAEQPGDRPASQQPQQHQQAAAEGSMEPPPAQHQEQQLLDVVQQAVPLYLRRSLAALPGGGSVEGLSASWYSLLRNLPAGSKVFLLAVGKVADRALELSAVQASASGGDAACMQGKQGSSEGSAGSDEQAAVSTAAAAADKLFELLVLAVQLGDYQLLPAMLQRVGGCVLGAPLPVQDGWLSQLYAGCLAVGDYTRKPALMSWVDALQKQLLLRQQKGSAGSRSLKDSCPASL
jgi:hypothetical protein